MVEDPQTVSRLYPGLYLHQYGNNRWGIGGKSEKSRVFMGIDATMFPMPGRKDIFYVFGDGFPGIISNPTGFPFLTGSGFAKRIKQRGVDFSNYSFGVLSICFGGSRPFPFLPSVAQTLANKFGIPFIGARGPVYYDISQAGPVNDFGIKYLGISLHFRNPWKYFLPKQKAIDSATLSAVKIGTSYYNTLHQKRLYRVTSITNRSEFADGQPALLETNYVQRVGKERFPPGAGHKNCNEVVRTLVSPFPLPQGTSL